MVADLVKRCKDCVAEGVDPKGTRKLATKPDGSLRPGPRCVTHWRARKRQVSHVAHGKRVESGFGITSEQYWILHAAQGGRCFICRKATGRARRLAVDHDHESGLVRGILCGPCNLTIGRLGIVGLVRALEYLHNPPATGIIGQCIVPSMDATAAESMSNPDGVKPTITAGTEPNL